MNQTVWRYKLKPTPRQEVEMPWGARILKLAVYKDGPCLWVLVDPLQAQMKSHDIRIYGTGEKITDAADLIYIGTLVADAPDGKPRAAHFFEALRIVL